MNELMIYEAHRALAEPKRGNYALQLGNGAALELKRGTDFDNPIVKTGKKAGQKAFDKPILQKSGAEKISFGFGLLQQYDLVSKVENYDGQNSYFAYTVRCDLVKLGPSGEKIVVSNSYGHANTAEGRNGFKPAADSANGSLKMAQKRALVGAALAGSLGMTTPEAKQLIVSMGYASTKDIKVKDYDAVIKAVQDAAEKHA